MLARRTRRSVSLLSVLAVIIATLGILVGPPSGPATAAAPDETGDTVTWGTSQQVVNEAPFSSRARVTGVSCPSAGFCASVSQYGVVRTAPGTAGPWTERFTDHALRFTDIACATASFCLAATESGLMYGSDEPATESSWRVVLDQPHPLTAVSCATTTLCAAAGRGPSGGGLWYSTDPIQSWDVRDYFNQVPFTDVSCAVSPGTLCKGVDGHGGEMESMSSPGSPFASWSIANAVNHHVTVSCSTPTTCVGRAADSTSELDCPTTSLCVEIDAASTTARRSIGGGSFTPTTTHPEGMSAVGCVRGGTACVVGTTDGRMISTEDAAASTATWTTGGVREELNSLTDVDCLSATACVAVDGTGHLLTSSSPTGAASAWTTTQVNPSGRAAQKVDCPTVSLCVVGYTGGEVVTVEDPFGARTATVRNVAGAATIGAVSCPSAALCVLGTQDGDIITSTAPTTAAWAVDPIVTDDWISVVTCRTTTECFAVTNGGHILRSTDPATDGWSSGGDKPATVEWAPRAMTCPSATRCLVGDAGGHLWRLNPSEDLNDWYEVPVAGFPQDTARSRIFDIDCSADDVCVAVSSGYLIAQAPGLDEEWWNGAVAQASGRRPTTYQGVACAGTTFCLAADVTGELVAGTVNHAPLSVVKTGTGTGTVTSDLPGIDCGTTCTDSDVPVGAVVVLTATPDSDSELLGWGDDVDCGTDPECEVTVKDGGTIVTPRFRRPRSLKVQILGGSSVQGADGAFPCWSSCESTYDDGEVVTLTATPDPGSTFSYWTGGCTGSANPCVVTMDADKIVRAHFDVPPTTPPATAAPVIRAAGVAPKSVARGKRVTFSVTSSARGVTRVLVGKPTVGRMVAGVCKPKTAKNKAKKKCTYTRVVTTLSSTQSAGRTAIAYRTKKLVPGTYRATITVTGTTGLVSRPKVLTFRVRKR